MKIEPETQISSELVFDGRIIRLKVDTVRLANGRRATREVAEHANAVVIVPIDRNEDIILVRQFRYPVEEALLEAPAGIIEDSESPDECAQRELQEEIGYRAGDLHSLGGFWSSPGFCTEFMYAYVARNLTPSKLKADDDENIITETISLPDVTTMIRNGQIKDAKTVAALLMAMHVFGDH